MATKRSRSKHHSKVGAILKRLKMSEGAKVASPRRRPSKGHSAEMKRLFTRLEQSLGTSSADRKRAKSRKRKSPARKSKPRSHY